MASWQDAVGPADLPAGPPSQRQPSPPAWTVAVQDAPGGARLLLDVSPGAKEARFPDGFDPWRKRLGMKVRAPAQEGEANAEVVRSLAAFFSHPTARVHIEAGATDRRKAVRLMGLDRAAVLAALAPRFQEADGE